MTYNVIRGTLNLALSIYLVTLTCDQTSSAVPTHLMNNVPRFTKITPLGTEMSCLTK